MTKSPIKVEPTGAAIACKINAQITQYSPQNAWWMGKCASLAYEDVVTIQATVRQWGFDRFYFFDRASTQAFIIGNSQSIVIAFRGTTCIQDWMVNNRILLVNGLGGRIHRGFWEGLNLIWADLKAKIMEFRTHQQSLLLTGHSLGGALATLAVAALQQEQIPVNGLYTFGSPRVGDTLFAEQFNAGFKSQAFRFVNNNDVVTRVVPRTFFYSHVGTCLYFDVKGVIQTNLWFWEQFLDSVKGTMEDFLRPEMDYIKDHDMNLYLKHLTQNLNRALA